MRAIGAILMILALGATPVFAGPDGGLDMFANAIDPSNGATGAVDFNSCQAPTTNVLGFFSKAAFSLYARLSGPTAAGISGAEFFIDGLQIGTDIPTGCTVTFTKAANTTLIGDATQVTGAGTVDETRRANLTWSVDNPDDPDCQKAPLTFLGLVEVQTPFGSASLLDGVHRLQVVAGNPPSNPTVPEPGLILCDAPFYTLVGIGTGGTFIINPDAQNNCTVAVQDATWSSMKSLYR